MRVYFSINGKFASSEAMEMIGYPHPKKFQVEYGF